jgi:hypothetical protein
MEMSKWEGMAGGMAMRTWSDALVEVYGRLPAGSRKDGVAKGIIRGITQNTDVSLMTREFTAKIQIISSLKSGELSPVIGAIQQRSLGPDLTFAVCSRIYGSGSAEARQAEAVLSSRLI